MSMDFPSLIDEYENANPGESVEYKDDSGSWQDDTDYGFGSISSEFQRRGHISRPELRKIGEWKYPTGRIDQYLKNNNSTYVEQRSAVAFQTSSDVEKIEALTELRGIRVPLASVILTMFNPADYAIVDYHTFRALGAELLDLQNYPDYAEFMGYFQNYNSDPEAYSIYMDVVRDVAQQEGILPREVDMALWAHDKIESS
ncbi:hypothetical protein SAMN04487967_0242 [Natronorubrum sediminis]|uniref:Uncharacterized protein n=1 Tax=Natronorubrum sediminis TaxID=640943 RepID=A0A1H6FK11_9EURY|nr:hypothetical protein [Natronorubrum sediminis]SEH11199.1 hypothetical protein SAMN04487967_0242 [Natronorubrum sediminis]